MKRHRWEPSALMTGLILLGVAAAFLCDAAGAWNLPPHRAFPLAGGALLLAAALGTASRLVRRRSRHGN